MFKKIKLALFMLEHLENIRYSLNCVEDYFVEYAPNKIITEREEIYRFNKKLKQLK